jgi:3-deoxy-D-arabino-heptulosonate 7-phosphate (DAHP) synthase class II
MTPPSSQDTQLPHTLASIPLLITQSEARRTRRTADDLAQQEAFLTQATGRRQRTRKVQFAEEL